jgi:hypothetical protein
MLSAYVLTTCGVMVGLGIACLAHGTGTEQRRMATLGSHLKCPDISLVIVIHNQSAQLTELSEDLPGHDGALDLVGALVDPGVHSIRAPVRAPRLIGQFSEA